MTVKEYEETQKEVIEIAMLLTELKKKAKDESGRIRTADWSNKSICK